VHRLVNILIVRRATVRVNKKGKQLSHDITMLSVMYRTLSGTEFIITQGNDLRITVQYVFSK